MKTIVNRLRSDNGNSLSTSFIYRSLDFRPDFATAGCIRSYGPGSELLQQGLPVDEIYIIHEGIAKLVWTDARGKQTILGLRWPGSLLGVPSAVTSEVSPMGIVTLVRSLIQRIPTQEFLERLQTNPDFAWRMHQFYSLELCEQLNLRGELACCSARSRLAQVFKRLIKTGQTRVDGEKTRLRLPLKQRELAELIGVTPEHLSRILNTLSKDGVLYVNKGWIVIPNPQALLAL